MKTSKWYVIQRHSSINGWIDYKGRSKFVSPYAALHKLGKLKWSAEGMAGTKFRIVFRTEKVYVK